MGASAGERESQGGHPPKSLSQGARHRVDPDSRAIVRCPYNRMVEGRRAEPWGRAGKGSKKAHPRGSWGSTGAHGALQATRRP